MLRENRANLERPLSEPWERLLILADDFTGAMDSGVQLAKHGLRVQVAELTERMIAQGLEKGSILVVNTETRHSSEREAYEILEGLTKWAVKQGVRYFYKKTDSMLRGNIGAELEAVLAGCDADTLFFIPAFPQIGRITQKGIQYWNGVPIHKTAFGKDPFEPVKTAFIPDVIACQSRLSCEIAAPGDAIPDTLPSFLVYDAETEEDLVQIAELLRKRPLPLVMAGCAGFAAMLPRVLGAKTEDRAGFTTVKNLLVVSGSVHPIAEGQLQYAEKNGIPVHYLSGTRLTASALPEAERTALLWQLTLDLRNRGCVCLAIRPELVRDNSDEARERILKQLADLTTTILERDPETGLLATGGDTLRSVIQRMRFHCIRPICELFPGVVAAQAETRLGSRTVITKAGGIGDEDIFLKVAEVLLQEPDRGYERSV